MKEEIISIREPTPDKAIIFDCGGKEMLRINPDGFFVEGEKVEGKEDIYQRFCEWLTAAEQLRKENYPSPNPLT